MQNRKEGTVGHPEPCKYPKKLRNETACTAWTRKGSGSRAYTARTPKLPDGEPPSASYTSGSISPTSSGCTQCTYAGRAELKTQFPQQPTSGDDKRPDCPCVFPFQWLPCYKSANPSAQGTREVWRENDYAGDSSLQRQRQRAEHGRQGARGDKIAT